MNKKEFYTQRLTVLEASLKALREQGIKALSRNDIEIVYQGDAEHALRRAKQLVGNQIKFYTRLIAEMEKESEQLVLLET